MNDLIIIKPQKLRELLTEIIDQKLERIIVKVSDSQEDELLTTSQALLLLKVSKPTLYKRIKSGKIKPRKIGKKNLFSKNELYESVMNSK